MRARPAALGAALAAVLAAGSAGACADGPDELAVGSVDRVLVVSLPGLDWEEVERADMPNLDRFVDGAAIADMATRIGRRPAATTDAYLTMGAGTRAVAPEVDTAVAVEPGEAYGGVPAAELLERRLGTVPDGIAYLGVGAAIDANRNSSYGAEVGTLGDHLDEAGVARAVIANADAVEGFVSENPPPEGAYGRGAATMLMGSDGIVPGGAVGRALLLDDPEAAFGRRLDHDKVLDAFDRAWEAGGPAVVVVEASDLARVAAYGPRATASQRRQMRQRAMADADDLLGALVERTDPVRDAVLVLSPVSPSPAPTLGVAALRAPGIDGGLLQSATTRRDGYVQLADVTPTVLDLVGAAPDASGAMDGLEGRTFQVGDATSAHRVTRLAEAADAAAFRDATVPLAVVAISTGLALLALATALHTRLGPRAPRVLAPLAYAALGVVPASFLVGQVGTARANLPAQVVLGAAIAGVVAAVAVGADRLRPGAGPLVAVGVIVGLIGVDILAGAPLQLNTTFGYSVAVAGRFTGLGNLAFALFGSATILLAALLADRAGRRGVRLALALMAAVLVLEGLPMMGADVGGVLSMVPAFGVTALVLAGRPVGWREVAGLLVATAVVLFGFALIDAARPAEVQTHLARLADQVLDGRWDTFSRSLGRRWQASLGGARLAGWITIACALAVAAAYAVLAATGRVGPGADRPLRHRPTQAAVLGLSVLGAVGLVANDSSVAVPMTMLIVVAPVAMLRHLAASP